MGGFNAEILAELLRQEREKESPIQTGPGVQVGGGPRGINIPGFQIGSGPRAFSFGMGGGAQPPAQPNQLAQPPQPVDTRPLQERALQAAREEATRQLNQPPVADFGGEDVAGQLKQDIAVREQRAAAETARKRRGEAQANIGPGAREFAPGQFYSGPESVAGTYKDAQGRTVQRGGRANNFSNQAGFAPLRNTGRGTLSMMQGNEILPSDPNLRRQAELKRAAQEAAIAEAKAAKQQIESGGQKEPKDTKDSLTEFFMAQGLQKVQEANQALAAGKITAEQHAAAVKEAENQLMQIFQIINRFSPDQLAFNPYQQAPTEG